MFCPLCGCRAFKNFEGRVKVHCTACGSIERHRIFGLFMLDRMASLEGKAIQIIGQLTLKPARRIAPELFRVTSVERLLRSGPVEVLFLCHQFPILGQPIADFFAGLRQVIADDGLVAFTYTPSPDIATYRRDGTGAEDAVEQFGVRAIDWFSNLPGWRFEIWRPDAVFGEAISMEAGLRYNDSIFKKGDLLITAVPTAGQTQ